MISDSRPTAVWDLIIDGQLDGSTNMAVDSALLAEVEADPAPRTVLRLYQWGRPTVSLGRNQKISNAVDLDYCLANGVDVVHRPTGGRAVLHDDELTYALISNDSSCFGDSIYGNYKRVSEALCDAFRDVGVDAMLACDTRRPNMEGMAKDPPCFISTSRYELMVNGRKIVGSAQRRLRRSFLQHGSMPIASHPEQLARITGMPDVAALRNEMAGISEFLKERPTVLTLTNAIVEAFKRRFGVEFQFRGRD